MNTVLDILGAVFIGGLVMFGYFNFNIYTSTQRISTGQEHQLYQNSVVLAEMLNYDLRRIGYGYSGVSIIEANEKSLSFYSDIDTNGVVDVVKISLVTPNATKSNEINPNLKILARSVNGNSSEGPSLGLVNLKFSYRDVTGKTTNVLSEIKYIRAEIWVEGLLPVEKEYPRTYWEMTIKPRNI